MTAIIRPAEIEAAVPLGPYCDTCGSFPCIYPPFCKLCQAADLRHGYKAPSLAADLKSFANRARELADQWRAGIIDKATAVDKAHNFGCALGLHYRGANSVDFLQDKPTDNIQRVLAAAFASPGAPQ
jgi:hypothetical protein